MSIDYAKSIKKRFWKGSLTWIPREGIHSFKRPLFRFKLRHEFAVLSDVRNHPSRYVREGEYHCGLQGCRELRNMGWSKWESTDIFSFHHSWLFNKRWNIKQNQRKQWRKYNELYESRESN